MLKHDVDLLAPDLLDAIAQRRQSIFDAVRVVGDLRLLHHACGAFERVGKAEQLAHNWGVAAAFLQVEDPARELVQDLAGFWPEIFIRILGHETGA